MKNKKKDLRKRLKPTSKNIMLDAISCETGSSTLTEAIRDYKL